MSSRPIRILFDAQRLTGNKTGVGYYTASLVTALAQKYPDELVLIGYHSAPIHDAPVAKNIHYRRILPPVKVINLLRRYGVALPVELLTFTRADFVLYPNFLSQPSLFGVPSAAVIHDLTFIDLPDYVASKNLKDLTRFVPGQIKRSSFVITVSAFAKRRLHEVFNTPPRDVVVTPIPPEPPLLLSEALQKTALRELGITGKYFLTLSTIEPRKNVLSMLDAFLLLPKELQQQYTLAITGMIGWNCDAEVARLKQLAEAGVNILHVGYVTQEQRAALYQNATFYTSASQYEGFGMTPLEAMSYSKACALSDIPVFKEAAGKAALYFDQQDPRSIAAAWQTLLTNNSLRDKLGTTGKQHAQNMSWDGPITELYKRITAALEGDKE